MQDIGSAEITSYFDVAQIVLYAFWIFFAGLVIYLLRENKREGYPLDSDRSNDRVKIVGFPAPPPPKNYLFADGSSLSIPGDHIAERGIAAEPSGAWPGAPLVPTGSPMADGVGPASYTLREDRPDVTFEGALRIAPLRVLPDYGLSAKDPDPRGFAVIALDGVNVGLVSDVWIDRSDPQIRYLEVTLTNGGVTLLPNALAHIVKRKREVAVRAVTGDQFTQAPLLTQADRVTLREEDKISAYFASGYLYAVPSRSEPLL